MSTTSRAELVFTRRQLYERVWSTPLSRLGPELGISDVGLRKLCERLDIPTPPVGYWAKRQHGKSPRRPRLPDASDADEPAVTFFPSAPDDERAAGPEIPPGPQVQVADELHEPHPAVEATMRSLGAVRPDSDGLVQPRAKRCLDVHVKPVHVDRAMRIMDALLKVLEARGLEVRLTRSDGQSATEVVVLEEEIRICLHQDTQREERAPTADEARYMRLFGQADKKFYHQVPTDSLYLLVLSGPSGGSRRRFADTRTRRLENLLDSFVRALYRTAHEIKEDRKRQEEFQRQREIAAQRQREWEAVRVQKLQEIAKEEERVRHLMEEAERWRQSQSLRAFIEAVREGINRTRGEAAPGSPDAQWLAWAEAQADRLDPMYKSPPSILDEKAKWSSYWSS